LLFVSITSLEQRCNLSMETSEVKPSLILTGLQPGEEIVFRSRTVFNGLRWIREELICSS
jgi:hypothetical protein